MTKPSSFQEEIYPAKRCSLCRHSFATGHVTLGLVCLRGDNARVNSLPSGYSWVTRDGVAIELLEGDQLDDVWVACTIHEPDTSVCDEFEPDMQSEVKP